jgi:hypothetical protein
MFGRVMALDRVLGKPDLQARRAYEERAARSAPGDGAQHDE